MMSCPLALEVLADPWTATLLRVDFRQDGRRFETCASVPDLADRVTVPSSIGHAKWGGREIAPQRDGAAAFRRICVTPKEKKKGDILL